MEQLGRFILLERVAKGGMGLVWRAYDPHTDRLVVIKTMYGGDEAALERFAREARLLAQLEHPNIVRVFEFAEDDGVPYIVMELVVGTPLSKVLSRAKGGLDRPIALRIAHDLCRCLAHVHQHGVVHRDVSAQNVMVTGDGNVKLLDFGIAKLPHGTALTQPGRMVGKPGYMAPEQITGGEADTRSDVYATGVLLYELCTGHRPFGRTKGRVAEVARAVVKGEFLSPDRYGVSGALSDVILGAMALEPDDRPRDAEALMNVLASLGSVERTALDVAQALRNIDEAFTQPALVEEDRLRQVLRTRTMPSPRVEPTAKRAAGRGRTIRLAVVATVVAASFGAGWFGRGARTDAPKVAAPVPRDSVPAPAPVGVANLVLDRVESPKKEVEPDTRSPPPPPAKPRRVRSKRDRRGVESRATKAFQEGMVALVRGDLPAARARFDRCLQIDSRRADCVRSLGLVYERLGQGERSAKFYRRYLRLEPNAPDRLRILGQIARATETDWQSSWQRYMAAKDFEAALAVVERASRTLPTRQARRIQSCVDETETFGATEFSARQCQRLLVSYERLAADE